MRRLGWFNFSLILKQDFEPFLPFVMPDVFATASDGLRKGNTRPPYILADGSADGDSADEDDDRGNSNEEWEEKALAIESLTLYTHLGALYAPYLDQAMQVALDGLRPRYSVMVMEVSDLEGWAKLIIQAAAL